MNDLGMKNSEIYRQIGITSTPTLRSSSDLDFLNCYILLCHNSLWKIYMLNILCDARAPNSGTRGLSGKGNLLLSIKIFPSD